MAKEGKAPLPPIAFPSPRGQTPPTRQSVQSASSKGSAKDSVQFNTGFRISGRLSGQSIQVRTGLFGQEENQGVKQLPIEQLKQQGLEYDSLKDPTEDEKDNAKYHDGFTGTLAKDKRFEVCTSVVIMLNALAIGYDADYAARFERPEDLYDPDFPVQFVILENLFALYFTFEILIRFLGYKVKWRCLCDAWFVFDSILVTFMVIETWLLAIIGGSSPLGQLSILRLLRLLRISRMAKLMRAFPELLMIIKGIKAAVSAVVWTAILLVIVTYTWAILFTNEYHQGKITDEEAEGTVQELFGSMGKSMFSLFIMGTILDDVTFCTDTIRSDGNMVMLIAFLVYILINSFTMMNMLVGILVEVVGDTATRENKRVLEESVCESIKGIFQIMDKDGSGRISRAEFAEMRRNPTVLKALGELSITENDFNRFADLLFQKDENDQYPVLDFEVVMDMLLMLRPGTAMSALDFGAFRHTYVISEDRVRKRIDRVEKHIEELCQSQMPLALTPPACAVSAASDEGAALRAKDACHRISIKMLAVLESTPSSEIVNELQRRLGMSNLEDTGVPLWMMDEDLKARVRAAEATFKTG